MTEMSDEMVEQPSTEVGDTQDANVVSDAPWYGSMEIDESTQGYIQSKGWDSPKALLDSYRNLEKFKGAPEDRLLTLPEEQLPENMGEIWNRLGRPETPEGYEVELPEGVNIDNARLESMRQFAHDNGITKSAFAELAKIDAEQQLAKQQEFNQQAEAEMRQQETELKNEWGSKYDESMFLAEKGAREMGVDADTLDALKYTLGFDGAMKMFHKVASAMGEKAFVDGEKRSDFATTPEQARYEMDQLLGKAASDSAIMAQWEKQAGPDYARYKQLQSIRHGA
jgi:hypothetical protein